MIFFKYIILSIYSGAYKRAKRQSIYPDKTVKYRFGLRLSFWLCLAIFLLYRILKRFLDLNINISTNYVLLLGMVLIILLGIFFAVTLNFELIKNINLTKKQKNMSRIVLLFLVIIILLLLYP